MDEWVKCEDKLPCESDGDAFGKVWSVCKYSGRVWLEDWYDVSEKTESNWKKTGLVRPDPPEA